MTMVVKFRDREQNGDCQGLEGEGTRGLLFVGIDLHFCKMKKYQRSAAQLCAYT